MKEVGGTGLGRTDIESVASRWREDCEDCEDCEGPFEEVGA
jgi:hypothetical protein